MSASFVLPKTTSCPCPGLLYPFHRDSFFMLSFTRVEFNSQLVIPRATLFSFVINLRQEGWFIVQSLERTEKSQALVPSSATDPMYLHT